jgi:succinate dehydrogenase / fumarate reductase cytochrome b subunit
MASPLRALLIHTGVSPDRNSGTRTGWWAWLVQRLTGVALVGYLFLHILVISTNQAGAKTFDDVLAFLQTPVFVVLDLLLVATVLFHALNGVRVILFDLGVGIRQQASIFWVNVVITFIVTGIATYFSFPLILR